MTHDCHSQIKRLWTLLTGNMMTNTHDSRSNNYNETIVTITMKCVIKIKI